VAEARQEVIEQVAMNLYQLGELPIGKAMKLAGLTRAEFDQRLKSAAMHRPFDKEELDRDLAWADKL